MTSHQTGAAGWPERQKPRDGVQPNDERSAPGMETIIDT